MSEVLKIIVNAHDSFKLMRRINATSYLYRQQTQWSSGHT